MRDMRTALSEALLKSRHHVQDETIKSRDKIPVPFPARPDDKQVYSKGLPEIESLRHKSNLFDA